MSEHPEADGIEIKARRILAETLHRHETVTLEAGARALWERLDEAERDWLMVSTCATILRESQVKTFRLAPFS